MLLLIATAGALFLIGLPVPAGLAVSLGLLGLMCTTMTLLMLSVAREYQAGHWPEIDPRLHAMSEDGNPAIYTFFGRSIVRMFRW